VKAAVVCFPGSNCEMDTVRAIRAVCECDPVLVWHKDRIPKDCDLVVLPGGFSYGDYLRVGAIARISPVMQSVIEFARAGGLILGICNGFQILVEAGLLPGALIRNRKLRFICKWVHLRVERKDTPFTSQCPDVIRIPIAHATGNYYASSSDLAEIEAKKLVVFRYSSCRGEVAPTFNPNGSVNNIAGIVSEQGNVLGMMPHPERAISAELGGADGVFIWRSLVESLAARR